MRLRTRPELRIAALAAIALACALTLRGSTQHAEPPTPVPPVGGRGLLGEAEPVVSLGDLMIVVLRTPSVAQRLAPGALPTEEQERSWVAEDEAAQQQVLTWLERHGLGVRPDYSFARVLDGFSARLGPRAVALLQRDPEIAGVYPVSVAYPATLSSGALGAGAAALGAQVALPGFDGAGVSIALLDTALDPRAPYLGGRVGPALDVLAADADAPRRAPAEAPAAHATELAGLLVGAGGPGGVAGVAPGASVTPIQVAGWQPDGHGGEALYARSDQLIAGLERAVDPSGAGDVARAARVALVGLAEPFDGFPDTPEAEAVRGALALGVLVVAPAGNDGAAGPWYGSIAGPGGSPAALTVGAVDSRPETASERLVVRQGLDVIDDATLPLLDGVGSGAPLELPLASAASGAPLAGVAALVGAGADPAAAVAAALARGARAVLLSGAAPPAGALGGGRAPVLWVPAALARRAALLLAAHALLEVALGGLQGEPNPDAGALAPFSSRGLAYDGLVDPELSAPGIDLATSAPGLGSAAYATVSGTSAAAAAVAGAAALLAQARPGLSATELASLLVGSARPGSFALSAGGTGVLDVGASAAGELAAGTTSLGFGVWSGPHWHAARTLALVNVSSRALRLRFETGSSLLRVEPATLTLAAGAHARVRVLAAASSPAGGLRAGILAVLPAGGEPLRVPWTIEFRPPAASLLGGAVIAPASFAPSPGVAARLHVLLGALPGAARLEIEPVGRLELRLYDAAGHYLGVLATLGDLLPGSYDFALSGRRADGAPLAPGGYTLELVAWPMLGGAPSRARVGFRIE